MHTYLQEWNNAEKGMESGKGKNPMEILELKRYTYKRRLDLARGG